MTISTTFQKSIKLLFTASECNRSCDIAVADSAESDRQSFVVMVKANRMQSN